MRNLTITRRKTFVASLAKMKVYIEDPAGGDTLIDGVNCRKLGTLKNGETKAFPIESHSARVYVIADKLSKNFCNDYYIVPEGDFDVFISGKNLYNPASGNAFRFDGTPNEEVIQNRKKGNKKGMIILIVSIVIGVIVGRFIGAAVINYFLFKESPETFTKGGVEITLTSEFIDIDVEEFDACYSNGEVIVMVSNDYFSYDPALEELTATEYGELVVEYNDLSTDVKQSDGFVYFEYSSEDEESVYYYIAYIFKGENALYLVQFSTEMDDAEEYRDDIAEWAKTIVVQ